MASRTFSQPGVIESVSGSGSPGLSVSSSDPAGPLRTTVSGAIAMPPRAARTSRTTAGCVPVGASGSVTPWSTTSVPSTSSGVVGPKRGVYSASCGSVRPWLTCAIVPVVPSGQVSDTLTSTFPMMGLPEASMPNVGRAVGAAVTSSPAWMSIPFGANWVGLA